MFFIILPQGVENITLEIPRLRSGSVLPDNFIKLSHSKDCEFEAIKHKDKSIYGFQFHPEVEQTDFGSQMIKNFVEICKKKSLVQ